MNAQVNAANQRPETDKVRFLMGFYRTDGSDAIPTASSVVLELGKADILEIVELSSLVHEKGFHAIQKHSTSATWIDFGRTAVGAELDRVKNKFADREDDPIGELNDEFGDRLMAEIKSVNGAPILADIQMPKLVVAADEVSWIGFPRRALAPYSTFDIKILDLCRRFEVEPPAHLMEAVAAPKMVG